MSCLLDTNIISELRKPKGDEKLKTWFVTVGRQDLFLSVLVVGEIRQGIERLNPRDPVQATSYEMWLETLQSDYRQQLLTITTDIAEIWGRLNAVATLSRYRWFAGRQFN